MLRKPRYYFNSNLKEYKLTAIVLDISLHIHFIPIGIEKDAIYKCSFLEH
jgi:hypothetical protein